MFESSDCSNEISKSSSPCVPNRLFLRQLETLSDPPPGRTRSNAAVYA